MRFGHWRGVTLAFVLTAGAACSGLWNPTPARAGGLFHLGHTIPRETLAQDYRTGGVYYAPPIPYGEYTKDYLGCIHGAAGLLRGCVGKLCGLCMGKGCGACDGLGCFHGDPCGDCGGQGCNHCGGLGLLHKHHGTGGGGLLGHHNDGDGLLGHGHHNDGDVCPTSLGGTVIGGPGLDGTVLGGPSAQTGPSPQVAPTICGECGGKGHCGGLLGRRGKACGSCGGGGLLHHGGGLLHHGGDPCGNCGGKGCGLCGGGHGHGGGDLCGNCGGRGCGLCGHLGKLRSALGMGMGLGHSLLNRAGIGGAEYFVGPGGPVPLTPGYVPYIVPVRSPREFFAFPPYIDRSF